MIKMKANNFSNNIKNLMGDFNMIYMKLLILNVSIFMLCTLNAASFECHSLDHVYFWWLLS